MTGAVNHEAPSPAEGSGINSATANSSVTAVMEHAGSVGFRNFVKGRVRRFKSVSGRTLDLHLKECEWRYNKQHSDLYTELLDLLKDKPL